MDRKARSLAVASSLEHLGLQELTLDSEFDAVMTVDAMENVPPEDWPRVLANLHRAARPGAFVYITVEIERSHVDREFEALVSDGIPAIRGEVVEGDVASYHYYPTRGQVVGSLTDEGLQIVDEHYDQQDGWGYRHFLLRDADAQI